MRILSTVLAILFVIIAFITLPTALVYLNHYFLLPQYNFFIFKILGFLIVNIGAALCLYCIFIFLISGKGTPVPIDPPKNLVSRGLYRFSRNPMYSGYATIILGEFFLLGSILLLVYSLAAFLFFHLLVVYFEEPRLKRKFGKSYSDYVKKVRRWL